jgi:hypothetical protein
MMRRTIHLIATITLTQLASGQTAPTPRDKALGYVATLAGPDMHGRGYVQGGDSLAAEWLAAQFDRIGLDNVKGQRFEPFEFPVNSFPDSVHLTINGVSLKPGIDFLVDPASGPASGPLHMVPLFLSDLLPPERRLLTMSVISGHTAYLDFPATTNKDSLALYASLEREVVRYAPVVRKARGKLTWSAANEQLRHALLEVKPEFLPDTAVDIDLHVAPHMLPRHQARNVLGAVMAKGGSKEWLVITAHYDHLGMMGPDVLFPGANDNASGVSMLLTLAEEIRKKPLRKNVLFICFAGEEAGLQGSTWCVSDRPIDLAQIRLLINLDLNGTGEEGITVVNATAQQKVFDALVAVNTRTPRLAQVKARGPACNSDHCPFAAKGVPAIFIYTMGGIAAYHDVFDRPETLPLTEFNDLHATLLELLRGQ